jgi:pseudouridine-5'-phosphate glycosidase
MKISQEVKEALSNNDPVVALESTIISHGMPYPENLDMARKIERIVRDEGAVPATIAIIEGVIHVGLNEDELVKLAQGSCVMKLSKRDIAYAISEKKDGATTVSATMLLAEKLALTFLLQAVSVVCIVLPRTRLISHVIWKKSLPAMWQSFPPEQKPF